MKYHFAIGAENGTKSVTLLICAARPVNHRAGFAFQPRFLGRFLPDLARL